MLDKVSVIMPVYNSEKSIKNAIESVISQTYQNWELIIVNDGSTDKTLEICNEYKDNLKIKIISKENGGPSSARNLGISQSNGKYIMFIDSDDTYENTIIEKMVNNMESDKIVCCNYYKINFGRKRFSKLEEDIIVNNDGLQEFIEKTQKNTLFNITCNKIYIRKILTENNILFNNQVDFGEDLEFNAEYFKYIKSAYLIKEPLYNYYIADSSSSFKYRDNDFLIRIHNVEELEKLYIFKKYKKDFIIYKYLESFIQSSTLYIRNARSKKICIERIGNYINIISTKIINQEVKIQGIEEKIIYNLIKRKDAKLIYLYLNNRSIIKKIMSYLLHKVYR